MSWEEFNQHPHTICGVIEKWAKERPDKNAFMIYDTEKEAEAKMQRMVDDITDLVERNRKPDEGVTSK